ncbi:MAG: NAD-dependent epimerase/dehydratase family protein [Caldilineae bacterium]|nr:NAD-dependent epimerase/dehydratase family protein [Anaerolineae bacterium]MCB9155058.1 NAD-dependent epimerase/dehydratase family protein [Caldilineae bacterium]
MLALVTGATGFVGANVVEALNQAGWQVRALHRRSSSMAALRGLAFEPVIGDVTEVDSLLSVMAGCDAVFHVAGVTADYWDQNTERLHAVNVQGTRNVVEAALATRVKRLVHTSSQAALGLPNKNDTQPMDETHRYNLPPETYPYGYSKHLAELEVQSAVTRGLHAIIVNPTVVLGPRDVTLTNSQIIQEVQRGRVPLVPPGGINVVDAIDLGRGHLLALDKGGAGERYLLAGHNLSNLDLTRRIAKILAVRPPRGTIPRLLIRPLSASLDGANRLSPRRLPLSGDVLRFGSRFSYADNRKAVRELGFTVTPLEKTLERAVAWLREVNAL